jgi:hypothetical protein
MTPATTSPAAAVFVLVALGLRALSGLRSAWFAVDLVFILAGAAAAAYSLLALLGWFNARLRPADALWVQRAAQLAGPAVWVAALLAGSLAVDAVATRWFSTAQERPVEAVRISCTRSSSAPARVTIATDAVKGKVCFHAPNDAVLGPGTLLIPLKLVSRSVAIGSTATLSVRYYNGRLLGLQAYYEIVRVN